MALTAKNIMLTSKQENGDTVIIRPYTSIHNVEGGVAMINGVTPSPNGNIVLPIVDDDAIVEFMEDLAGSKFVTDQEVRDFINGLFTPTGGGHE